MPTLKESILQIERKHTKDEDIRILVKFINDLKSENKVLKHSRDYFNAKYESSLTEIKNLKKNERANK